MVEKKVKQREFVENTEEKIDMSLFKKKSSAKTPKGLVVGYAKKLSNSKGNLFTKMEMLALFVQLHKEISNLETSETFRQKNWRGKSGINFLIFPNKVICVSHQKFEPGEKPKEIRTELTKEEINKVIGAINKLDEGKEIPTPLIAEQTYGQNWKKIFVTRKTHIKFTKVLNYLEYRGDINYSRVGKIKVLRKIKWW